MKGKRMLRKIDELGRVVIPVEVRRALGIEEREPLEIHVSNDSIIITKFAKRCVLCSNTEGVSEFHDKGICATCRSELSGRSSGVGEAKG